MRIIPLTLPVSGQYEGDIYGHGCGVRQALVWTAAGDSLTRWPLRSAGGLRVASYSCSQLGLLAQLVQVFQNSVYLPQRNHSAIMQFDFARYCKRSTAIDPIGC